MKRILLFTFLMLAGYASAQLTLSTNPVSGDAPLTVTFKATCATCKVYTWDFGDNSGPAIPPGPNQTHIYKVAGTYNVIVAASDSQGHSYVGQSTVGVALTCGAPTFPCANRSVASIPVPTVPPNAGGPGGANTYMVDPDFHNVIVRATDYTHTIPSGHNYDGNSFQAGCGGGAGCLASNTDRTLWLFETMGGGDIILRFDPVAFTKAVDMIRAAKNTIPTGLPQSVFGLYTTAPTGYKIPKGHFSWKQKNLFYSNSGTKVMAYCFGTTYVGGTCNDTLSTVPPSVTNGRIITVVDYAKVGPNCLPAGYAATWAAFADQDEQDEVFAVGFSSLNEGYPDQKGSGQNTGVHVAVWSKAKGCQVLNTYTGKFTADVAWGTNGKTLSLPDRFTLHSYPNLDLSGTYMVLSVGNCLTTCFHGDSGMFVQLGTATGYYLCAPAYGACGGHASFGYSVWQNDPNTWQAAIRPMPNTNQTFTRTPLIKVPEITCTGDRHYSWVADDPTNVTYILASTSSSTESQPAKVCNDGSPLRNELSLYDPKGSNIARVGHTFNSGYSGRFSIQWAILEWTKVGDFAAWGSDWLETLGDENGHTTCPGGVFHFNNWTASTALTSGTILSPQAANAAGFLYKVTTAGTTGVAHPVWSQTIGAAVKDGSVTYKNIGSGCRGDVFITDLTTAY